MRMKKIIFIMLLIFAASKLPAQVMQAKAVWATLSVPQLKCWECKERLDEYLLTEKGPNGDAGIIQWKITFSTATIRIQYVPDRITLDYIKTAIANAGFDVDTVKADDEAYKKLPPICKRSVDGGGQKKGDPPCSLPPNERN